MIDNKGKLFGKINIIDLCVILIILLEIVLICFKFGASEHKDVHTSDLDVQYTIEVEGVRDFTVNAFHEGDLLYNEETDKCDGEIVAIETEPAHGYITCTDGTIKKTDIPERYCMRITVKSPARISGDEITLESGHQLRMHQNTTLYTQTAQTTFGVIDIQK